MLPCKKCFHNTFFFICLQSPNALETRVRQLHDRRDSRAAVRRDHVRVQHRGGQHGEETTRGLVCPEPERNPLHHHLISKVLCFYAEQMFNLFNRGDKNRTKTNQAHSLINSADMFHSSIGWILYV